MGQGNQKYTLDQGEDFEQAELLWRKRFGIISTSRGKSEGRLDGAKRPTAGDEPREFASRGEGGRVPPFFEKLHRR